MSEHSIPKKTPSSGSWKTAARSHRMTRTVSPGTFTVSIKNESASRLSHTRAVNKRIVVNVCPPVSLQEDMAFFMASPQNMDKLFRIADIIHRAKEVFEDKEKAQQWLSRPQSVFRKLSPLQYAETQEGAQFVLDVLGRIEYGVFS